MKDKVLVVTGGLITSQETSLWQAAQVLGAAAHARHAWLDVKVKLTMAEPLVAKACELALPFRPATMRRTLRDYFRRTVETNTPPLTEVVLATLLEKAGLGYECMSLDTLYTNPGLAAKHLAQTTCVFLSSTYLHDLSELETIVGQLKRPHNRLVVGGALVGVLSGKWGGLPCIDLVAVGYGEMLADAIADWLRSGCRELRAPPRGRIEQGEHCPFIYSGVPAGKSLDELITPDWSLAQESHAQKFSMIYYESVRDCPYRCSFCNYPFLFDDTTFRFKSARKIADDWEWYVKELGVEYITCLDSLFTIPRDRLTEFCNLLIERHIKVKWVCYARADDLADEATVVLMKAAGAHQVQIGIESGDPQLLENMNKACDVEANRQALANCRNHGLTTVVSLIVGFPGETAESLERTYRFLETTPPDFYFLATFSTRVAGVPLLEPENRLRFELDVMPNLYSMAPYWRHRTMSCADVGNHVRELDRRLMANGMALNAALFYQGLLGYDASQRETLLDFQRRVAKNHVLVRSLFGLVHRWVDRRLRRDVTRALRHDPDEGAASGMNPVRYILDGRQWLVDPYGFLDTAQARHGLTFRAHLPVLGNVLMTGDPNLIQEIVHHKDLDGGKTVTALRAILGSRSLIMLEGDAHATRRRLIAPSFRGEGLAAYDELTVRVTREALQCLPLGKTFSIYAVLRSIGLKIMVAAMFGEDEQTVQHATQIVQGFLESFRNPLFLFFRPLQMALGSFSPWGRMIRNRNDVCEFIRWQMQDCRNSPRENTILGRLVAEARSNPSLGEKDLVEEVLSLLLFGHDTAAATMAWAFAHIYQNREVVDRIFQEAGGASLDTQPDPEALSYLKACINESMRLCPVVVHLARRASADIRLGQFTVTRGTKVIPCTYLAQHDPKVFPDPHEFQPERFMNGQRYEHSYFPFGFGNRTCVGKPFASRQMLLIVATATQCVELELAPGYRVKPARHLVVIVPAGGGLMQKSQPRAAIATPVFASKVR